MSIEESLRIVPHGEIAVLEWDLVGERVNKLNTATMTRFKELLEELAQSSYKAVVMISKKPKIFIAGADIDEIKSLNSAKDFDEAVENGQNVMNMVEDLPIPVIAAVHGACMGGGCELILACDYRISSASTSTKIGLPETQLGIIPGFGGCVRLPRVVGLQASLDIILAGKSVIPKKALKIGLVDKVVHEAILFDEAMKWAQEIISQGGKKRRKVYSPKGMMDSLLEGPARSIVFKKAKETVLKTTHGHYPAPLKAIEVIRESYGLSNRNQALAIERMGFCEVAVTTVSKNLISVYYLTEMVKKQTGLPEARVIETKAINNIGVLGAGTMGGGIAYVAADKGIRVRLKDINTGALGKGFSAAYQIWKKQKDRKRIDKFEFQKKMDLVSGGVDYAGFKNLDLVVEAIVEDMDIKKKVIAETASQCRPDCLMVTNTSSLSVSEMALAHPRPENFAGMHFFNPVHRMPLIEVIRGEKTSDETVATVFELSKKMGKMPVVVKDGPGFLVNRLLLPYMSEAAFLLQDGMSIEKVDKAFVQEFGMPMGPYELMDEVGLDVCVKVVRIFKKAFGERIGVSDVIEKLSQTDRLGKKNGKGFYRYDEKGKRQGVDSSIYQELGLPTPTDSVPLKECIERGVFAMINEAALALYEDRIVEKPEEVDLAMIMGTGFPPFRGGLLRYADSVGSEYIVDQLEIYATDHGGRLKPTVPLRNMAKTNRTFY